MESLKHITSISLSDAPGESLVVLPGGKSHPANVNCALQVGAPVCESHFEAHRQKCDY